MHEGRGGVVGGDNRRGRKEADRFRLFSQETLISRSEKPEQSRRPVKGAAAQ